MYYIFLIASSLTRTIGNMDMYIAGAHYNDPSSPLFKMLNILKLKDMHVQSTINITDI